MKNNNNGKLKLLEWITTTSLHCFKLNFKFFNLNII